MTGKQQEPTPGVHLREVIRLIESIVTVRRTEKRQGPTPGVRLIESIVIVK